jgi:sialic acid synthase SpsE
MGANFNGDLSMGNTLIRAAAAVGADAIKCQLYDLDLYSPFSALDKRLPIAKYCVPFTWLPIWADLAHELGMAFICSAFSKETTEIAAKVSDALKIASCEANDPILIADIANQGLPVIASVGMTSWYERWKITDICQRHRVDFALLACTVSYPCAPSDAPLYQLSRLLEMKEHIVGISDHTLSVSIPAVAVAMGAQIVEKHFTINRGQAGPDHKHSLTIPEFEEMVRLIRQVERAKEHHSDGPQECELSGFRRSLHFARDVGKGETLGPDDIIIQRPADGASPEDLEEWVGRVAERDYKKGEPC